MPTGSSGTQTTPTLREGAKVVKPNAKIVQHDDLGVMSSQRRGMPSRSPSRASSSLELFKKLVDARTVTASHWQSPRSP